MKYAEIAANFQNWNDYFNGDAAMSANEFNAMCAEERIALLVEAFGPEDLLMNPATGSVDTRENWSAEGYDEKDGLLGVVANVEGQPGYDAEYGEYRPA